MQKLETRLNICFCKVVVGIQQLAIAFFQICQLFWQFFCQGFNKSWNSLNDMYQKQEYDFQLNQELLRLQPGHLMNLG